MSNRTVRINELVRREISEILRRRYQSESVTLTITEVRVAPDLRDARVFVSIVGDELEAEEKLRWLRKANAAIREELGKRVVLKFLPHLTYIHDKSFGRANRVLGMLDEIGRREGQEEKEEKAEPVEKDVWKKKAEREGKKPE